MCVVNKQFGLIESVFDSVYVDMQCDEISLSFTAGYVSLCCVCSHMVVFCLSRTLCGCYGCCECDTFTVVCVACVYTESA